VYNLSLILSLLGKKCHCKYLREKNKFRTYKKGISLLLAFSSLLQLLNSNHGRGTNVLVGTKLFLRLKIETHSTLKVSVADRELTDGRKYIVMFTSVKIIIAQ